MDVKWKSDKHCIDCKREHRKEIISEVQESCKKCPKMFKTEKDRNYPKAKKKRSKNKW